MDIAIQVLEKHAKTKQKRNLSALLDSSFPGADSVSIFDIQQKCKSGDTPKLILELLISMDSEGDIYLLDLFEKSRPPSGWHIGRNNVVKLLVDMDEKCLPFITRNVSRGSEDIGTLMSALNINSLLTNEILDLVSKKYSIDINSGSGWMRSSSYSTFMDALSFDSAMYIINKRKAANWEDFYAAIPAAMRSLANLSKFGRLKDVNGRFIADSAFEGAIFALNDSVTDVTLGSKIRWSAADALGNIGDRNSVQNLLKIFLDDKDEFVRGSAALALGKIGDTSVVPMLNEVFSKQSIVTSIEDDIPYGLHGTTTLTAGILEALAIFKHQSS
jgi:hypothetical protein